MTGEFLVPGMVHDHTSYYRKLQEIAIYAERADFQALEQALSDRDVIKFKNSRMIPLYQEITAIVKHINNTDEKKTVREYYQDIYKIKNNRDLSEAQKQEKEQTIKSYYQALIDKIQSESQESSKRIDNLHEELLYLYNLLRLWDQ